MKISDIVDFNPPTTLQRGQTAPFIDMAALSTSGRGIALTAQRQFSGSGSKFRNGDTLFARITPCLENGKGGYVDNLGEGVSAHGSTEFIVFRAKHSQDSLFVYYLTRNTEFREFARQQMSGTSGRQRVSWQSLADYEIPDIPPQQRAAIGSTLSALDDKIELNNNMSHTLGDIADALFKDWFIDFGPTRAKLERKPSYLSHEIWSLFPEKFDEGGKPEGWSHKTVGDIAEKIAMGPFGSNIKVETFVDRGVPIISGKHLFNTQLEDKDFDYISEEHAQRLTNSCVRRGDIVFTHAGNIGQVSIIPQHSEFERYVLSQRQFYLRPDREKASPYFLIHFFKSSTGQHKLLANASQVGVPSISRPATNLRQIAFICPPKPLMRVFDDRIEPIHMRMSGLRSETSNLVSIRNLLLPKLMSGEISLREAEKLPETVM